MKKIVLKIGGMGCDTCRVKLEEGLNKYDGIKANVSLEDNIAVIEYDENLINVSKIEEYINDIGYESLGEK